MNTLGLSEHKGLLFCLRMERETKVDKVKTEKEKEMEIFGDNTYAKTL